MSTRPQHGLVSESSGLGLLTFSVSLEVYSFHVGYSKVDINRTLSFCLRGTPSVPGVDLCLEITPGGV